MSEIDYLLRFRANVLTGLTRFDSLVGAQTIIPVESEWTRVFQRQVSNHDMIHAYQISLGPDVSEAEVRICAKRESLTSPDPIAPSLRPLLSDQEKIYPFSDAIGILDSVGQDLHMAIQVPMNHIYEIHVRATGTVGSNMWAKIDYLSVIDVEPLSNQ